MKPDGKVRVLVKSRRVPAGTIDVPRTLFSFSGLPLGTATDRLIRYDRFLDEEHQTAVEKARRISDDLGLDLEIVDLGRQGFFGRLLSSLGLGGRGGPTIVVSPSYGASSPEIPQPLVPVR